jgi:DNA-directed RNA polymerase specialized sigma24 family protein
MSRSASHDRSAFFPTTDWSLLGRAGDDQTEIRRDALATVLRRYLPALRAHLIWRRRVPEDRADDLIQSFVCDRMLEQNLIVQADHYRGSFRSFLRACLNHYVSSQLRRERAHKRSPHGHTVTTLNEAALRVVDSSASSESSDEFDRAWAKQLVAETLRRMKQECGASGRHDVWTVFTSRIVEPLLHGVEPDGYTRLADECALRTRATANNLLTTAKRMFARCMRQVVGEYARGGQMDTEIRELMAVLRRPRHATALARQEERPCPSQA